MDMKNTTEQTLLNGKFIPSSEITKLAFSGFAHFTAIQVRNRKIKGLDLHLERLNKASLTLYNRSISDTLIRSYIRSAIKNAPLDHSITITIYSPKGEFTVQSMDIEPAVLIRISAPSNGPVGPLRLAAINHERPLAQIKHVGEIGKTYYLHQAVKQGFDDAIFVNKNGHVSEGSIWNLVFWDCESVIWPKANMLKGTMMGVVQRQLSLLNIPQREETITMSRLSSFQGAAVMNSWTAGVIVTEIESIKFTETKEFIALLHNAYKAEPLVQV
jgi:branched-subunit amino acid aminotransferase/4-amino-4-deoxychorismate lyase